MQNDFKSILVIVIGFLLLSYYFDQIVLSYVAVALGLLSVISHDLHRLILKLWFGLAKVLGFINSRILLTVVYVLVLLPLSLLNRLFGSNSVQLKKKASGSYFVTRDHKYVKVDLENPW